ncbi:MAG: dTDP-4-dehydrorhamnose reductase [Burkholderiales bacterium]
MRILLIGRNGQLGWELERALAPLGEVIALDRAQLDLSDAAAIRRVTRDAAPGIIVNAAGYTAVDRAESEPALAASINGLAPGILGEEARRCDALLVHYSTDYVFDGEKADPYREEDSPNPISVYGQSKLEGERAIRASGCRHVILRTSWVYAARGNNFLRTVLRLSRERGELSVVGDQAGSPTAAHELARGTAALLRFAPADGTYHLSGAGETSWYEFARAIVALSGHASTPVRRITTQEYPTAARRPRYSVLSNEKVRRVAGIALPYWRESLAAVCSTLAAD